MVKKKPAAQAKTAENETVKVETKAAEKTTAAEKEAVKEVAKEVVKETAAAEEAPAKAERFIPISPGYGFLVRDRKHPQKAPGRKKQEKHDAKKHPSGGEEDPRPNEDYEWMYMLVDSVTIPERSFIRASFDTGKATLENICKEAVDGIILKKWTAQEAADYIGRWAVEMTHDYFNTKLSPPKSATTQLTSTQYQPLFDTGRLYNSISYSVEGI